MKNQFAIIHNTLADGYNSTSAGKMKASLPSRAEYNEALIANGKKDSLIDTLAQALIEVEQMIHANELNEGTMAIVSEAIKQAKNMGAL